jgi:hypothetical protein
MRGPDYDFRAHGLGLGAFALFGGIILLGGGAAMWPHGLGLWFSILGSACMVAGALCIDAALTIAPLCRNGTRDHDMKGQPVCQRCGWQPKLKGT